MVNLIFATITLLFIISSRIEILKYSKEKNVNGQIQSGFDFLAGIIIFALLIITK